MLYIVESPVRDCALGAAEASRDAARKPIDGQRDARTGPGLPVVPTVLVR